MNKNKANRAWITSLLHQQISEILVCAQHIKEFPDEIEHVHQFRVRIRHLRSLLSFFKPYLKRNKTKKLIKTCQSNARHFSLTREMDVLNLTLKDFVHHYPEHESYVSDWLIKTKHIRESAISSFHALSIIDFLHDSLATNLVKKKATIKKSTLQKRLYKWTKQTIAEVKNIDLSDYQAMHDVRKHVKMIRYINESTSDQLKCETTDALNSKALSQQLGVLSDVQFIKRLCVYDASSKAITDFYEYLTNKEKQAYQSCYQLLEGEKKDE